MAIDERAPSALEKRLRAPKHDRRGEQKLVHRNGASPIARISGWPGSRSDIEINRSGIASAVLTQNRRAMSASSGLGASSAATVRGSSAIPHFGQFPGWSRTTSGCIGQTYSISAGDGAVSVASSAIPHFGHAPGASACTSGSIGQVYLAAAGGGRAMRRGIRRVHRVTAVPRVPMMGRRCGLLRRPHRRPIGARVVVMAGGVRPACGRTDPARRRRDGRLRRRAGEIFRRLGGEFRAAAVATEIVGDAVVDVRVPGGRGIDLHPAYRIGRLQSRLRLRRRRTLCSGRAHNRIKCRAAPLPRLSLP